MLLFISIVFMEILHLLNAFIDYFLALVPYDVPAIYPLVTFIRWVLCRSQQDIRLAQGTVIGTEVPEYYTHFAPSDKVVVFRGIPFAEFQGRFQAPLPVRTEGVDKAKIVNPVRWSLGFNMGTPGSCPPQSLKFSVDSPLPTWTIKAAIQFFTSGYAGSEEEGLQLNVFAPKDHMDAIQRGEKPKPLPVMVFIPGGAFVFGSCHQNLTSGAQWAKKDCININISYRLGLFGYLRVPGMDANCGLRDQLEALRWIQNNVHHFGGDKTNVTLSGHSAGAMSVGALLGTQALYDEKLATKAFMISGTAHYLHTLGDAKRLYRTVAEFAGVPEDRLAAKLLRMTTSELMSLQEKVEFQEVWNERTYRAEKLLPYFPIIEGEDSENEPGEDAEDEDDDGTNVASESFSSVTSAIHRHHQSPKVLTVHPLTFLERRRKQGLPTLPLLIGSTDNEYTIFSWYEPHRYVIKESHVPLRMRQWTSQLFGVPFSEATMHDESTLMAEFGDQIEERNQQSTKVIEAYIGGGFIERFHSYHALFDSIFGDFVFRLPSEFLASAVAGDPQRQASTDDSHEQSEQQADEESADSSSAVAPPKKGKKKKNAKQNSVSPARSVTSTATTTSGKSTALSTHAFAEPCSYVYRFDYDSPIPLVRSGHILDIHFIFGNWHVSPYFSGGYSPHSTALGRKIMNDIHKFIAHPNPIELSQDPQTKDNWPLWSAETRPVKVYGRGNSTKVEVLMDPDSREVRSWGDLMSRVPAVFNADTKI